MNSSIETVWKVLDDSADYVIDLTQRMIRVPSVNPKFVVIDGQNNECAVQDIIQAELCRGADLGHVQPCAVGLFLGSRHREREASRGYMFTVTVEQV
ncbi:hypothetical protein IB279_25810 [Ensifer sp. ENS06]|uniref:hypothetical protein n=1 Tax=Ensifer sp. ENS06 TaxID=2769276 RepID=UPI0013AFAB0F|nr:hypothetical protein [Ensifer sp. ENS06]MBD9626369.1 hypothetical protein [Ensifer sp. ENS06]